MTGAVAVLVMALWLALLLARDGFWRNDQRLVEGRPRTTPAVVALVPARDEAATIEACVRSLVAQDYAGELTIIVVDDGSADDTATRARRIAAGGRRAVHVVPAPAKPPGWSGKVAAQAAGWGTATRLDLPRPWLWLTDADVVHAPDTLDRLMATADAKGAALVSVMVRLSTVNLCERWLVPAFVYFFELLYPFRAVNDPERPVAAAAGGCILVARDALERAGGFQAIHDQLIDDIALATAVKRAGGRLWLVNDARSRSLRRYDLGEFGQMVARTAFTELRYSYLRLAAAIGGLALIFLGPILLVVLGDGLARLLGGAALAAMVLSYGPIVRAYRLPPWWLATLPAAAMAYMAMTLQSAWQHVRGAGAVWHGRSYRDGTEG